MERLGQRLKQKIVPKRILILRDLIDVLGRAGLAIGPLFISLRKFIFERATESEPVHSRSFSGQVVWRGFGCIPHLLRHGLHISHL